MREPNLTKIFFEEVAFKLSNEKNHTNQDKSIPKKGDKYHELEEYWTDLKT